MRLLSLRRLSVKARLALLCGGLFLLSGVVLLTVNYFLVRATLPPTVAPMPHLTSAPAVTNLSTPDRTGASLGPAATGARVGVVSANLAEYRDGVLNTLFVQSVATLAVTLLLALLLGWIAANRVLRPVRTITSTARRLSADNLDQRIRMQGPSDEFIELADTFDAMLDRLDASFEGQRRFVANASHELRTPIAAQRTLIEVSMADPDGDTRTQVVFERLLGMNVRIEFLIEGLLTLARSDRGITEKEEIRLDELAETVLDNHRPAAAQAEVTLHADLAPVTVLGDRLLVERLIANLVDNAIKYNHRGGALWLEVREPAAVRVTNTGPEVPADSLPGLLHPFRQLRPAPSAVNRGVGLGLSIVASIARAHGGSIRLSPRDGGGLSAVARLR